jgi:hypothetical protein
MRLDNQLKEWPTKTAVKGSRSVPLQALDAAAVTYIGKCNAANVRALDDALAKWLTSADSTGTEAAARSSAFVADVEAKVKQMIARTPIDLCKEMENLDAAEWFTVNIGKRPIAPQVATYKKMTEYVQDRLKAKTFADFGEYGDEDYNCFTYAQHHSLWTLGIADPQTLANCDIVYNNLGYDRVYPDPKATITMRPDPLSDTAHQHMLLHEPTHEKVIVYGRTDTWSVKPLDFTPMHHVLRVAKGYEGKMGVLPAIFHKTLPQVVSYLNGSPHLLYRKR